MISFRYHVVTIVAVFLALAIGLLAGSAFVQPELVDQLRAQTDRLRSQVRVLETELTDARAEVTAFQSFMDLALPYLASNRLLGESVVLVTQDGVDDVVLEEARRSLADAGAEVVAVLTARASLGSDDPEEQDRLAQIVDRPNAAAEELPSITAAALAGRLANGTAGPADGDLLDRLLSAGFLDTDDPATALEGIGLPGQAVVVLGGGVSDVPPLLPAAFGAPLVTELIRAGVPVAVGESTLTPPEVSLVDEVRAGEDGGTVTVDDLDLTMGGAALVLGLDELITTGQGGAYGFGDGAEPLPPPP